MLDQTEVTSRTGEILDAHRGREGALLPILHDIQAAFGHIPADALPQIASAQQISAAELHGVISFYHDFRRAPAGRNIVKLCRAEACQAQGCESLADHARSQLAMDWHDTSPDGRITLEPVFCLGLCACGPAAMINGAPVARLDKAKLDRILEGLK